MWTTVLNQSVAIKHSVVSAYIRLKQPVLWVVCLCLVDVIVPNGPLLFRHCGTMVGDNERTCTAKRHHDDSQVLNMMMMMIAKGRWMTHGGRLITSAT